MAGFKRILIPVDFGAHSAAAVRLGAELARAYQGSLTLLHVFDPLPYALPESFEIHSPEQRRRLYGELESELSRTKREAEAAGAPNVEVRLVEGYVSEQITEVARRGDFDIIVMGTHGRRGVKHALLGSVAERIVRTGPCPVLTVKGRNPRD